MCQCCIPSSLITLVVFDYFLMLYFLHTTCTLFHSPFYHTDQPTQSPTGTTLIKVCQECVEYIVVVMVYLDSCHCHVVLCCLFSFSPSALFYPRKPYHNLSPILLFVVVIDHNGKLCCHLRSMWRDVGSSRKSVWCGHWIK